MLPQEKMIIRIALVCALVGLTALFIISKHFDPKEYSIKDVRKERLNSLVKVSGVVESVRDTPKVLIITLEENKERIKIVAFKEGRVAVKKNQVIEIEGRLTEYEGEIEIEADRIKVL